MAGKKTKTTKERLEGRLVKNGSCLEWTGCKDHLGRGQIRVDGVTKRCHRVAWELKHGPIPKGMCICHNCDNPPCCNVNHLFIGTQLDNIADMENKDRRINVTGEKVGSAKLTLAQVMEIRRRRDDNKERVIDLAAEFGVDHSTISNIVAERSW